MRRQVVLFGAGEPPNGAVGTRRLGDDDLKNGCVAHSRPNPSTCPWRIATHAASGNSLSPWHCVRERIAASSSRLPVACPRLGKEAQIGSLR